MIENTNPLLPNYPFNLELVAGITQIEKGNYLDFTIDRPNGMNGYILHLTTLGKGIVFDGENYFTATKGQLLLFSPQAIHHYHRDVQSKYWHHQWVYFYPNEKWSAWIRWSDTHNHIGKIMINNHQLIEEISQIFSQIELESQTTNKFKQDITMSLLEYLLIKCFSIEDTLTNNEQDSRIVTICNLILEDLSQNISIEELAQRVYLSPSRLSHLFKQSMGMSIIHWRETQKMLIAKKRLYFSNSSITSLAKALGYDDPLYFSKVFKKHSGFSPQQFRTLQNHNVI